MSIAELLRWQWNGYEHYHRSRSNLILHIVIVPLFLIGNIGLIMAVIQSSWLLASISVVTMVVSIALQGRGHRQEQLPPARRRGWRT